MQRARVLSGNINNTTYLIKINLEYSRTCAAAGIAK